ncbi:MAG: NAD(P)H-binding protein [Chloroflexi bacterium]|nr:NAD(P)H-binding protein [Chloroflexota bacterium]
MPGREETSRVLVTGGTGFLGFRVVAALLEAGANVSVMVRPGQEEKLQALGDRIQLNYADVWNKASLKGRARGHSTIVHLVGSTRAEPERGLTYQQINLVSARNVTSMAVSDGVPRMILLSAVIRPLSLSGEYIRSKREAEEYLQNSGLNWTIVRAPSLFAPNTRNFGLQAFAFFGALFPFNLFSTRMLPLPVDIAARGIAQLALKPETHEDRIIYARQLRQLAKGSRAARQRRPLIQPQQRYDADPEGLDEPPFGWLPPHS